MTAARPTTIAGSAGAGADVHRRVAATAPVLVDVPGLIVAGHAGVGVHAGVTAVFAGRLSDVGPLLARVPDLPRAEPAVMAAFAYGRLGQAALSLLRGEWLVVIWDGRALTLARDPLGGRSAHHARAGSGIVFGEDARDVLALLPATPAPDRRAVSTWLGYGAVPAEGTLFAGVHRLGPGTALRHTGRTPALERFWEPAYGEPDPADGLADRLRTAIDAAVVRAAGPSERLGVLLSGGLDSAIVAASLATARPAAPPLACSGTFPGDREADESELIDTLTRSLGLPGLRSVVEWGRPLQGGLRYLATWKLPSTSPNTFLWLPLLADAAGSGVEVMLDGQGGDELFDQRPFYLFADLVAGGRLRAAWGLTLRYPGSHRGTTRRHRARVLAHFLRRGLMPASVHRARERRRAHPLLSDADAREAAAVVDEWSWLAERAPRWWAYRRRALVTVPQLLDAAGSLRRTATLAGVTDRHPFMLDSELVEFALRAPPEPSFDARHDRPVARASQLARVPDEVRLRPGKSGLSGLLTRSLDRGERALLAELLDPRGARLREFLAPGRLGTIAERLRSPIARADAGWLWQLGALECWLRQLEDPRFADELADRSAEPALVHRVERVLRTST